MRKLFAIAVALALLLLLCACSAEPAEIVVLPSAAVPTPFVGPAAQPEPAPETTPEPTAEPTPAPTPLPTTLTLTDESAEEILAYAAWTQLEYVDATASREYEALRALQDALPDCRVEWQFDFGGETYHSQDKIELKPASTEELAEVLRALPRGTRIDLLDVEVPDAEKDALMEANPDVDFLWWVSFRHWTLRSDTQVFSTLLSGEKWQPRYSEKDLAPLFKYCRHLKALDLGHNNLQDLSLLGTLSELQVLILVDNPWLRDISPLANLTELRYLEIFVCPKIEDMSPIRALTKLEDVNFCHQFMLDDPTIFDDMPNLKVCWLRDIGFTKEQKQAFLEAHPDAKVEFNVYMNRLSAVDGGWRATDENVAVRTAFYNYRLVTSFDYWEDIRYDPESEVVWLRPTMGTS